MRVMHAGQGYLYLLKTVAAGDGDRDLSTPFTRYYQADGTLKGSKSSCVLSSLFACPSLAASRRLAESACRVIG
jgi:hypothetical protein